MSLGFRDIVSNKEVWEFKTNKCVQYYHHKDITPMNQVTQGGDLRFDEEHVPS